MTKYLCEICQKEVYNPAISIDMTRKILCSDHYAKFMGIIFNYVETNEEVTKIIKIEEEKKNIINF